MKHLPLSLLVSLALVTACDAAIIANSQQAVVLEKNVAPADGEVNTAVAKGGADIEVKADLQGTVKPDALDIESISYLVKKGKVKDAAEIEKKINNPKEKLHTVDIDGDGKIDKIQVVEVQKPDDVKVFELHVIPSKGNSKADEVIIAHIDFVPDKATGVLIVKAVYTPVVIGHDTIVYDYTVPIEVKDNKIVVVNSSPFYGWLFTVSRPAYVGVIVIDHGPRRHKYKGKGKGKGWGRKWH